MRPKDEFYWRDLEPYWTRDGDDPGRVEDKIQGDDMPRTSEMKDSKFLKQQDLPQGKGLLVTVGDCEQYNMAMDNAPEDWKWGLSFDELPKPLALNSTNIQLLEQILGSDNTDDWKGQRVVLYVDPNVTFKGKIVGGIRVRAPKVAPAKPKAKPEPEPEPDYDEDVDGEAPL